jgi:hypothetical protein
MFTIENLEDITFSIYRFFLRASDILILPPYKGSTFRGAFGITLKRIVCPDIKRKCDGCSSREKCIYSYIFETPVHHHIVAGKEKPPLLDKYPSAPHPFIIDPPLERRREYRPGDLLPVDVTLIGNAVEYLPYIIYTFEEMGRRGIGKGFGTYIVESVESINENGKGTEIFSVSNRTLWEKGTLLSLKNLIPPILQDESSVERNNELPDSHLLILEFQTPVRIKSNGKLVATLPFSILITNLLRRFTLLGYFHCGVQLRMNHNMVIDISKSIRMEKNGLRWHDWKRFSKRQEELLQMGGLVGIVQYNGAMESFLPLILLGKHLHLGKGTAFGLGKYRMLSDSLHDSL